MVLSVSEMATKPRPSSERPTITMRLTSSAEPRSSRRFLRRCLLSFIETPQSHDVGFTVVPTAFLPTRLQFCVVVGSLSTLYERHRSTMAEPLVVSALFLCDESYRKF